MAESRPYFIPAASHYGVSRWRPSADVYHGDAGWLVKCDLAGVRPEEIDVAVTGRRLTISGIRRDMSIVEGRRAYSLEIAYDRFERTIELPFEIERAELEIDYRDGMLLVSVRMPKT